MPATPIYDTLSAFAPNVPYNLVAWDPPNTPLSTPTSVATAIVTYLVIIFGGRAFMKGRAPMELRIPFLLHNLALTAGSAALLACMLEEIIPIWHGRGFYYAICGEGAWTMRLETFYIINYFFKYWELIDTIFLVLKKKPLAFLHVYHHSATAVLCFSQLNGKTSISWVVICLNLAVHVLMYFYYALTSLKIRCPWKKSVTTAQITQFVIDLAVVYFASYNHFAHTYFPRAPHVGSCSGKEYAAWAGIAVLTSYLFLFIAFYQRTYSKAKAKAKAKAQEVRNIVANGTLNGHAKAQ